jgi:hypothetical protein
MVSQDDGVLPKTKTMTRAQYTLWYRERTAQDHRWVLAFDVRRFRLELAAARRARPLAPLERHLRDRLRRKHLTGIVEIEYTPVLGGTSGSPAGTGEVLAGLASRGPGCSSYSSTRVRGHLF